ncbi:MAG: hypothetical protein F4Z18_06020 [Caldilineaceae bacterium SB0666_bin_21]|nr:hypothetical protein [Caldilineaceae bacterium SB0666_bin_21]
MDVPFDDCSQPLGVLHNTSYIEVAEAGLGNRDRLGDSVQVGVHVVVPLPDGGGNTEDEAIARPAAQVADANFQSRLRLTAGDARHGVRGWQIMPAWHLKTQLIRRFDNLQRMERIGFPVVPLDWATARAVATIRVGVIATLHFCREPVSPLCFCFADTERLPNCPHPNSPSP